MTSLAAAQSGDERSFAALIEPHRRELHVHCYRMLGSLQDAEDALQETLVAAWKGLGSFAGRSSLRSWLYRIATNCCLRVAEKRGPRLLSTDYGPSRSPTDDLGQPVLDRLWVEPWPGAASAVEESAGARYDRKDNVGLAFIAALQKLSPNQRAVLILREVLEFSANEVAELLDTSTASVNSAVQRARKALTSSAGETASSTQRQRELVDRFVAAFERADVDAIVELLAADVQFTMPPLPAWFDGRADVSGFLSRRVFATPWRGVHIQVNGQPAMAGYQQQAGVFRLGAIMVFSFRADQVSWIASFLDPGLYPWFGLPLELP